MACFYFRFQGACAQFSVLPRHSSQLRRVRRDLLSCKSTGGTGDCMLYWCHDCKHTPVSYLSIYYHTWICQTLKSHSREQLEEGVAWRLFTLLERYHSATEAVAYPLPQGYNSFLAYLAHRCLPHHVFMQYVRRGVLQLNVDVLREIVYGLCIRELSVVSQTRLIIVYLRLFLWTDCR